MISEELCDTEEWINDAGKSAVPSQEYITLSYINHINNIS